MELKDMSFLSVRNIGISFFGNLVVSQDVVKELFSFHITDTKVYEGLVNARICHGFNDILVIDLKELVRMYVYLRADKYDVIQVLGYLIDRGVVYERPGAAAWYEQERYKIFGPETLGVKE